MNVAYSNFGVERRLNKLFRHGRSLIISVDPASEGYKTSELKGVSTLDELLDTTESVLSSGATAIMATPALSSKFGDALCTSGLVARIAGVDGVFSSVKEAVRCDASAVCVSVKPGSRVSSALFSNLAGVAHECRDYSVPLLCELVPPKDSYNSGELAGWARLVSEYGCSVDVMILPYVKGFEKAAGACIGAPVFASCSSGPDKPYDFLFGVEDAMKLGASGVVVGKNVWGFHESEGWAPKKGEKAKKKVKVERSPADMASALSKIIFGGKGASQVLGMEFFYYPKKKE